MVVKCGIEWAGNNPQMWGKGLSLIASFPDILTKPRKSPITY